MLWGAATIPVTTDFHDTVAAWAKARGIDFLDLNTPFARASAEGKALFFLQDIHFTSDGHKAVAGAIERHSPELVSR
jgi:lysophospholipase L1-like esterase